MSLDFFIPRVVDEALPKLSAHLLPLLSSAALFTTVHHLSQIVSPLLSRTYPTLNARTRRSWDTHVVSCLHAAIILPLAISVLYEPALVEDEVWGYSRKAGHVYAVACGYFLWDTIESIRFSSIGMVVHGVACLAVFGASYRPFLSYYGARFLLWELSTPLLNIHWFLEKTGRSGSPFMIVNAVCLMAVFFLARVVYGNYMSFNFFKAMYQERSRIPLAMHIIYEGGNVALNGLNAFWFSKMCAGMARRLRGERKGVDTSKTAPAVSKSKANGVSSKKKRVKDL